MLDCQLLRNKYQLFQLRLELEHTTLDREASVLLLHHYAALSQLAIWEKKHRYFTNIWMPLSTHLYYILQ